ncbi:hypothetical protein MLAC_32280 [Mycobacterium lacus]|uniref:Uncharacterized protein n=1 Tax=Mycobacterium lacus TaxID=169765 RepID=A0A7I7NMV8_9MYCO|nr:hypothetical protein MLAC_32280 [Mycobacterium lacus]
MLSHRAYGTAAAAIAIDAGPCHDEPASTEISDENEPAAEPNSAANPSQADAASSIGPEPAPLYISAEFTSGGATTKFIAPDPSWLANLAYRPIAAGATMIGEPRSANNAPV